MSDTDGSVTTEDPQTGSAATGSAEADSQGASTTAEVPASADAGTAEAVSQTDDGPGTLKAGVETPTQQAAPDPFEKRWKDTQAAYTRERQARLEHERQLQEMQKRLRDFEEKSAASKLSVWDPKHPGHQNFARALERRKDLNRWLSSANTPEQKEWIRQLAAQEFPNDLRQQIADYENYLEQKQRELFQNPDAYIQNAARKMAEELINEKFGSAAQTFEVQQKASQEVGQWFGDPANAEIIKSQRDWMHQELQRLGNNPNAWELVRNGAEARYWRSRVSGVETKAQTAEEKERLLRGNAAQTVSTSPKTARRTDPVAIAKERGIRINSPQWFDLLRDLDQAGKLGD